MLLDAGAALVRTLVQLFVRTASTGEVQRANRGHTVAAGTAGLTAEAGELTGPANGSGRASADASRRLDRDIAELAISHVRSGRVGQAVCMITMGSKERRDRGSLETVLGYAFAVAGEHRTSGHGRLAAGWFFSANRAQDMVALCRQRRFAEASAISPRDCRGRDDALGQHGARVVALLRAFALSRGPRCRARNAIPSVQEALEAARPVCTNEFDYLTSGWAELRQFVERCEARCYWTAIHEPPRSLARAVVIRSAL